MDLTIRAATTDDIARIVQFTIQEAQESQDSVVDIEAVQRGVSASFEKPPRSTYWVVEDQSGELVASTSILTEWSDFHGAEYWWIQSFYIVPARRGKGLSEHILTHLTEQAKAAGALELRLYVHGDNQRAIRAYERFGFAPSPYTIMSAKLNGG